MTIKFIYLSRGHYRRGHRVLKNEVPRDDHLVYFRQPSLANIPKTLIPIAAYPLHI